ncbi:MAG TPA: glycosyltransferase family 4 protein, partial [Verrucomicrobiae bacterium]|nr:glycosyltransferase family 4 protein [Verrucomicrobiae bacterium]
HSVTAVHSYEDCSLWQFEEAKRRGKACIYDMPIGYYPAWEATMTGLAEKFADWLPPGGLPSSQWVRPEQKRTEMELADLVLAPSAFVKETILRFHPNKKVALASYGVDLEFWRPEETTDNRQQTRDASGRRSVVSGQAEHPLRFIYAGQCSIRKGTPVLLEAWRLAEMKDAKLELVGSWQMAPERLKALPANVTFTGPVAREELRARFQAADVFVFPSFFEGLALALLEAMACGLAVIGTEVVANERLLNENVGREVRAGDLAGLIDALRWFSVNRAKISGMKQAARARAEACNWVNYRGCVSRAMTPFV